MNSSMDSSLYLVTNDCQEAVDEVMDFFKVFHSMRYVHDQLVLRLETEITSELLDDLNRYFKDLIVEGSLERSAALPEEKGEVDLKDLPRLVFHFNRRSHGRLRQLINCINQGTVPEKCRL